MAGQALGVIETKGLVAAVAAADAAAKGAGVDVTARLKSAGSGMVTVLFEGDVGAVQAAVDAAAAEARRLGQVVAVTVIARPANGLDELLGTPAARSGASSTARRRRRKQADGDEASEPTNDSDSDNGG